MSHFLSLIIIISFIGFSSGFIERIYSSKTSSISLYSTPRKFASFIAAEPLQDLIPKELVIDAISELYNKDSGFLVSNQENFDAVWAQVFERLPTMHPSPSSVPTNSFKIIILLTSFLCRARKEDRDVRGILGTQTSDRLLDLVEAAELDAAAVKAFMSSPPVAALLSSVLYEGIKEFLLKADILGNIVNQLPIIGPIRVQIMKEVQKQLDRTLGKQVQQFLVGYNKALVQSAVDYVLKVQGVGKAMRSLGDSLLSRPVASLIPSEPSTDQLRNSLWGALTTAEPQQVTRVVDDVYIQLGKNNLADLVNVDDFLDRTPAAARILDRIMERYDAVR